MADDRRETSDDSAPAAPPERQATIDELRRRNAELEAVVAARDAFLAMASHELRNPMTPIVGQVQRLNRMIETRNCTIDDVAQGLKRIEWLIGLYVKRAITLLDVSRITSGKLRLDLERVDVSAIANEIVDTLVPAAQHAGSALTRKIEDGIVAETDRLALEQILDNLILNAVKYGGGKPVDVALRADADTLYLEVRDQGIGMSVEDQARVFEPFERAIAYGTQAGFGIGLWVVRQLVDAMGGTIDLESAPGKGTRFKIRLPYPRTMEQRQ